MGLSNFPSPAEGMLPLLVMNTVMSVARVKSKLRSVLQVVGGAADDDDNRDSEDDQCCGDGSSERRVWITRYSSLCRNRCMCGRSGCGGGGGDWVPAAECCVCLCRFEGDEEVSELSCKHFFHKGCWDKWFDNHHISCPLCRSIM